MSDFPRNQIAPPLIHSFSRYSAVQHLRNIGLVAPATQNWGTANTAVYVPMYLPWPYNVRRLFWTNGSTVAGNSDIGIYSIGGGRIYSSGSTPNAGSVTAPQYVAADVLLGPGAYFLAWTNDGTSNRTFGSAPTASLGRVAGLYQQATALPLPALATFAAYAAVGFPFIGISNLDSGF
jgi:hypothetical protein